MKISKVLFSSLWVWFLVSSVLLADVRLPKAFTDNAVLQRDTVVKLWGWADAGEKVKATWNGRSVETTACDAGKWSLQIPSGAACCEGKELVVEGKNKIVLQNVVVGEVWICSGQSNMEQPLNSWGQPRLSCTEEEISGDYSFVRFNRAFHQTADKAAEDVSSHGWTVCKDGNQKNCTACGFHFAVRLHKELGVPVGLIDVNWGGSNINSWIPDEGWNNVPETAELGKQLIAERQKVENKDKGYHWAGGMYYAMLAPWRGYTIRGALWYQGCSNAGEGGFYYYKQKAMILEWRKLWGQGDFPFYWVQLANFRAPSNNPNDNIGWATIRDGQTRCMEVPYTGQAVIVDIGEEKDIHPRNKYDVGNRLALWALANDYGKNVVHVSPMIREWKVDGNKMVVKFDQVGSGLVVGENVERQPLKVLTNGELKRFAIAGEDKVFHWATAKIVGKDTVELTCEAVPNPVAARYAWQQNPEGCNLYSTEGLPATPFRTDSW